ncbi:MAG: type IV pilus biogenesis/stability protein PilW [Gammaproteobacteria bacterium]|nr:MAG: type IV pilus biogenesis/stability protein PilW [Gammaproteobacteria bacterium]
MLAACAGPSETRRDLERAAELNAQLGHGYLAQGRLDQAKRKFEKALAQNPRLAAAHAGYALLWTRLGRPEEAEKHFERALRLEPSNPVYRNNYGTFLCSQGRYEAAEKQFMAALRDPLYETPEYAYTNAGRCAIKAGDLDRAERHLRQALAAAPNFADALLEMAVLYEKRGQPGLGYAWLKRFEKAGGRHTAETLSLAVRLARDAGDRDGEASYRLRLEEPGRRRPPCRGRAP